MNLGGGMLLGIGYLAVAAFLYAWDVAVSADHRGTRRAARARKAAPRAPLWPWWLLCAVARAAYQGARWLWDRLEVSR